nr:RNA-dependent RNA polymerase [Carnation ringspot virus]UZP17204.1 RNA-dependent RNA polymerase [Carnation ringspot virus]
MAIFELFSFDIDKLLVWVSKFSPGKILSAICRLGLDSWNNFRKWFFGLNFDKHEWAVDHFMPLMPRFSSDMDEVAKRIVTPKSKPKLEDCLEIDTAVEEYFNEECFEPQEDGSMKLKRVAARRQIKRVRSGMIEDAISAVEARIRNRHMIMGDDMGLVDEAAVRATAMDICGEYKINEHHTRCIIYAAAYRAMTPDQESIDATKMAYNPKSQARRDLVSILRKNISFGGFKSLEDFLSAPVSFPVEDAPYQILGIPEIKVADKRASRVCKFKRVVGLPSLSAGQSVCVHKTSLHNMIVSLEQRVFRVKNEKGEFVVPPQPSKGAFDSISYFREAWKKKLYSKGPVVKSSIDDVVACYSSEKKKLYQKAAATLSHRPLHWRDSKVRAFIKVEKLECDKKAPVPRTIQPRSKRYNLCIGRYLRLNEKRMLDAIDAVFGEKTVLSGLDNKAQGRAIAKKWSKYESPIGIGLDASRFDQHCSKDALKFEHSFYRECFPDDKTLSNLLDWQLENEGSALMPTGELVKYRTKGCRMSGDINTGLGNKILMCSMVHAYLKEVGVNASLANNGDDCVLFCEKGDFNRINDSLREWFLCRGFNMVVEEPVECLERVVFCRSQPVCVATKWAMVRQLGSLSRDCFSTQNWLNPTTFRDAMNALGQCNGIINDGVPVHMAQAKRMYAAGGNRKFDLKALHKQMEYSWRDRLGARTNLLWSEVEDSTRLSYFRAFGIEPAVQRIVEGYFSESKISEEGRQTNFLPTHYSRLHKDLLVPRYLN